MDIGIPGPGRSAAAQRKDRIDHARLRQILLDILVTDGRRAGGGGRDGGNGPGGEQRGQQVAGSQAQIARITGGGGLAGGDRRHGELL